MQFTRGPWFVTNKFSSPPYKQTLAVVYGPTGGLFYVCSPDEKASWETTGNAYLMMAAPDLYTACETALEVLENAKLGDKDGTIAVVKSALNKARGL